MRSAQRALRALRRGESFGASAAIGGRFHRLEVKDDMAMRTRAQTDP
jgi:hypothetical protein